MLTRNATFELITTFDLQAQVAKNHVARAGLDDLSLQKKKTMITKQWLLDGCVSEVKAKLKGFEGVDPVRCVNFLSSSTCSCKDRQR